MSWKLQGAWKERKGGMSGRGVGHAQETPRVGGGSTAHQQFCTGQWSISQNFPIPNKPHPFHFSLSSWERDLQPREPLTAPVPCGSTGQDASGANREAEGWGEWCHASPQSRGTHMLLTSVPAAFSNTSSVTSRPAGNWGCCGEATPINCSLRWPWPRTRPAFKGRGAGAGAAPCPGVG